MGRGQSHLWTVEECATVTATEACGRLPHHDVAALNRSFKRESSDVLILGATEVTYVATPCRFGGGRFWLICPTCGRQVFKLYAPPPYSDAACRSCHHLTYESRRPGPEWLRPLYRGAKAEIELMALRHRRGRKSKRFYRLWQRVQAARNPPDGLQLGGVRWSPGQRQTTRSGGRLSTPTPA